MCNFSVDRQEKARPSKDMLFLRTKYHIFTEEEDSRETNDVLEAAGFMRKLII